MLLRVSGPQDKREPSFLWLQFFGHTLPQCCTPHLQAQTPWQLIMDISAAKGHPRLLGSIVRNQALVYSSADTHHWSYNLYPDNGTSCDQGLKCKVLKEWFEPIKYKKM